MGARNITKLQFNLNDASKASIKVSNHEDSKNSDLRKRTTDKSNLSLYQLQYNLFVTLFITLIIFLYIR